MASKKRVEDQKTQEKLEQVEHDILQQLEMLEALALEDDTDKGATPKRNDFATDEKQDDKPNQLEFDDLYDEHADSEDERWVRANLMTRPPRDGDDRYQLSCPSCFTLLCVQCQPHERYTGQFRALDVRNCTVKEGHDANILPHGQGLKTVVCTECETQVAVREQDGTYIFCNVAH